MTSIHTYLFIFLATNFLSVNFLPAQQKEAHVAHSLEGATCETPFWITLPLENFEGSTEPMGDNYSSNMTSPPSNYINGNDMVFRFTVSQSGLLFGNMTASDAYIGVFIMQDCPDPDNPALLSGWATSYVNSLTIPSDNPNQPQEILLLPGDYYFIVSSYPPPQTIEFTLNLWLEPLAGCPQPIITVVPDISANSAVLGWTETGDASQWDILYGETGFDPGTEGTLITDITQNPFNLNGLTANTSYDFYVRSVCDVSVTSPWTGPKTFNTECDFAVSIAFSEGFESQNAPPDCWQMWYENPDPPAENKMTHSQQASFSGDRAFRFSSMVSGPPYFQYLRSPELDFDSGLEVSFLYSGISNIQQVLFSVGFSEDGDTWTWGEDISDADNSWKLYTENYPSSTRYIAIQYKGTFMRYLFVDDFSVTPTGNPQISIAPEEFSFALSQGDIMTDMLYISNIGDAGLSYSAAVEIITTDDPDKNQNTTDNQWLSIAPEQGMIASGTTDTLLLSIDAGDLPTGIYQAGIVISSNDPDNPTVSIPVSLDVLTGINPNTQKSFRLYPVPARNHLIVESQLAYSEIRIYDAFGKMLQISPASGEKQMIINTGRLPSGLYLLKIYPDNGEIINRKFMIQK
jgi:hypothetical protein